MAQRAVTGEEFWEHRDEVRAVAGRVLRDAVESEDVSQETLLRALASSVPIDADGRGAWLTVVGRRLAIDSARQRQRTDSVAEPLDRVVVDGDPAVLAEHRELLTQVWRAVGRLNDRQQRLLLGQVIAGLSLDQLAAEEETSVASVRSVLARARESVRAFLHDTGWLAALTAHRGLSAAREAVGRVIPQLPRETGDALGAVATAVALLLGNALDGAPSFTSDTPTEVAVATPSTAVASIGNPLSGHVSRPGIPERLRQEVLDALPVGADGIDGYQVIPFSSTAGEIVQFAVSPDQKTVFAHGGYAETEESAADEQLVKEWEPTLYRSDDGGRHWKRVRPPGFMPGRVLFAPAWPTDDRIFVVTDDCMLLSLDGGHSFRCIQPTTTVEPGPLPRVPGSPEELDETEPPEPDTTIRSTQRPPPVSLRPAVLSPRFSEGDERIFLGDPAEVFDARLGVAEPVISAPPWHSSRGIAPVSDFAESDAVLVGAAASEPGERQRGALFRCEQRQCTKLATFPHISEAPGVFTSPNHRGLVFAWTTYATYRSVDGGTTWQRQVVGPVVDLVEVDGRLVFLSLSGVPISDDRGATWRQLRILYSISAVAPIGRQGLLLAAGPGMACSPDRGETWLPACA